MALIETKPGLPPGFSIRAATVDDVPVILGFIRALAEYEKRLHQVSATVEGLRATLFGDRPAAEVALAEVSGQSVGFALFFPNFSTFLARPGIYLEDLFVLPEQRGRGIGKALLVHVARLARERACGRFEWQVLDWNTPSIGFYESLGAQPLREWITMRVTGADLDRLASGDA